MINLNMFETLILLQDASDIERSVESQSLYDIIVMGGPMSIAIVAILLLLSMIAVYIFVERYMTIKRATQVDDNFIGNIRASVQAGNIPGAIALCRSNATPQARMVEKGLMRIGKPLRDIDAAIENVGNVEVFKLEKNLSTLASIAGAAPMVGFFGTVTGMILAFYQMSTEENVTPALLAGGIYQALLTTAFGLAGGIFAFVGYNLLVASVEIAVFIMERTSMEFMDLLQEPVNV